MKRPAAMAAAIAIASGAGLIACLAGVPVEAQPAAAPVAAGPGSAGTVVVPELPAPAPPTAADLAAGSGAVPAETSRDATGPVEWETIAIADLRARAEAAEVPAMEELARRLLEGAGVTKDQPAAAGWLLRAAQAGSARSAFNVGVMYERGFVVDRDSSRAIEWYRKAVEADVPAAKHNLALLLRDGKGAARNGKEAIELLRSAALQGMAASMFTLGDIYERGDAAPKDAAMALGWFAVTAEFERQTNRNADTALSKAATQRVQTLQRILTPAERERGRKLGQQEFDRIVAALQPPKPAPPTRAMTPPSAQADGAGWGKTAAEQIRAVQQALFDMGFLRNKPDGVLGPVTRTAIRTFQKSAGLRETGEPTRDVYMALRAARRDVVTNSPLPPPPKADTAPAAPPQQPAGQEAAKPDLAPYPAAFIDQVRAVQSLLRKLDLYRDDPDGALGPGTRNAIRAFQKRVGMRETGEPTRDVHAALQEAVQRASDDGQPELAHWPAAPVEQTKAIQRLLRELKLYRGEVDGATGPATRAAIRAFQKSSGLTETGEADQATFEALKKESAGQTANRSN